MIVVQWLVGVLLVVLPAQQPRSAPVVPAVAPQRASRGVERTRLDWAALRRCESGGNYANKSNQRYRGGYQFSRSTWVTVGGSGDPADASPEEQDHRAALLFQQRGRQPWPVCGSRL